MIIDPYPLTRSIGASGHLILGGGTTIVGGQFLLNSANRSDPFCDFVTGWGTLAGLPLGIRLRRMDSAIAASQLEKLTSRIDHQIRRGVLRRIVERPQLAAVQAVVGADGSGGALRSAMEPRNERLLAVRTSVDAENVPIEVSDLRQRIFRVRTQQIPDPAKP